MTNNQNNTAQEIHTGKLLQLMDPKSDIVFKKIFGQHPKLIMSFLNSIMPLPENRLIKAVEYLTPEQSPRIPSMKNTIVDVKCTDQEGRIFIVEMQLQWHSNFDKRLLYGATKAFSQQFMKGMQYSTLCPVYGVAIVNDVIDASTVDWYHHYRLIHTKNMDKALEGLELIFLELPKFKPQTFVHRKLGVLWLRFLKEMNVDSTSIPPEFQEDPDLALAVELAQEASYTKEELIAYDYYLDAISVENTVRGDSYDKGQRDIVKNFIRMGIPLDEVAKGSNLSMDIVRRLAEEVVQESKLIN